MLRAQLYDILCRGIDFDIDIYRSHLLPNTALLELGVGTGRSILPLIDQTHTCVGIDHDPDMIAFCTQHPRLQRLQLLQQDIATFSLPQRFNNIHIPLRTFQLLQPAQQKQCIDTLCTHLEDTACIIIHISLWKPDQHTGHWRFSQAYTTEDGGKMLIEESALAHHKQLELCYKIHQTGHNQLIQASYMIHRTLYCCTPDTLIHMLEKHGLQTSIITLDTHTSELFIVGQKR